MNKLINKYNYKIDLNQFKLGIFCVILLKKKIDKVNSFGILIKKRFRKTIKRVILGNFYKKSIIIVSYNLYSNNIKEIILNDSRSIFTKRYSLYHSYSLLKNI